MHYSIIVFIDDHLFMTAYFYITVKKLIMQLRFLVECWDFTHVCHFAFRLCDIFCSGKNSVLS